ncbi:MAG TPA: DUF3488 domain-containing protein, partial [Rubrivivax sp.]|nr:DUF3488 domain-containing protein [Rubrivivax sp.]
GRQFELLRALGIERPDAQTLATVLVGLLGSAALGAAAWAWWDRRRQDPWQRLQQRVQQRLGALGVRVAAHESALTRAERVRTTLGAAGQALAAHLDALARGRYGGQALDRRRWWRRFRTLAHARR